jgi:hypothetical protein
MKGAFWSYSCMIQPTFLLSYSPKAFMVHRHVLHLWHGNQSCQIKETTALNKTSCSPAPQQHNPPLSTLFNPTTLNISQFSEQTLSPYPRPPHSSLQNILPSTLWIPPWSPKPASISPLYAFTYFPLGPTSPRASTR